MDTTISQRDLRNDSGEIMRRVERGESFTVTRNGTPVADLVPHRPALGSRSRFVLVEVLAASAAELPDWDVKGFRRELDTLDLVVDDGQVDHWNLPR